MAPILRTFIDAPDGTVHCAIAGTGRPVVLLHQTPRSWDEYRDVIPILARRYRAIAIDTIGFGDSSRVSRREASIESWARTVVDVLDALHIRCASFVGHHTGAVIASEIAAAFPERTEAAVLSSMPLIDADARAKPASKPAIDKVTRQPSGMHLLELWKQRQPYYPAGDVDLLERFVVDALKAGPMASAGHDVVAKYKMEERLSRIRCPVLIIAATADPFVFEQAKLLEKHIRQARTIEIPGGMVPLPDQMPAEFSGAVSGFLDSLVWPPPFSVG